MVEPRFQSERYPLLALTLLICAGVYQMLLVLSEGLFDYWLLMVSIPVVVLALTTPLLPTFAKPKVSEPTILVIAAVLMASQWLTMWPSKHLSYYAPPTPIGTRLPEYIALITLMVSIVAIASRRWAARWIVLATVIHLLIAGWVLYWSKSPKIDVFLFHQESAAAMLRGENPYAITFKNVYLNEDGSPSRFYSLEVQRDGRVMFGFPYPPMSMWLYLPSYWLSGESRYAHAVAFALAGLGIAFCSRGRVAKAAGALLLTAPAGWVVVENAWTEPFLLAALVGVGLAAIRAPAIVPITMGVFLSLKQYNIIFLPLVFLMLPRPLCWRTSLRFLGLTVLTGALVSLPLAVWDWAAFWNSNVTIQIKQPFRFDAFSYLAMFANDLPQDVEPPAWWSSIAFILLVPTWLLLLWRMPRNIKGFTLGVAVTSMVFLFSNRQAFLNYHTFSAGALLLAVAVMEGWNQRDRRETAEPPVPRFTE